MEENKFSLGDKVLIASSYCFALPSLYIILSEKRKNEKLAFHASQALLLWIAIIIMLVLIRLFVYFVLSNFNVPLLDKLPGFASFVFWLYAVYRAISFLLGKNARMPLITFLSEKLA